MFLLFLFSLIQLGGLFFQAVGIFNIIKGLIRREYAQEDISDATSLSVICSLLWSATVFLVFWSIAGLLDIVLFPEVHIFIGALACWIFEWVLIFAAPKTKKDKECDEKKEQELKVQQEQEERETENNKQYFDAFISRAEVVQKFIWKNEEAENAICAENQKFSLISAAVARKYKSTIQNIQYSNIVDCQIVEDNSTVVEGGVGRAIVGGMIAGGAGAIVGASTRSSSDVVNHLEVRIITNDLSNARTAITLIDKRTYRSSDFYKEQYALAQDIYSMVIAAMRSTNPPRKQEVDRIDVVAEPDNDISDLKKRLEKISRLKEAGIISEKEYDDARAKILSEI